MSIHKISKEDRIRNLEEIIFSSFVAFVAYLFSKIYAESVGPDWILFILVAVMLLAIGNAAGYLALIGVALLERWSTNIVKLYEKSNEKIKFGFKWGIIACLILLGKWMQEYSWKYIGGLLLLMTAGSWVYDEVIKKTGK